jgi:hypothetical protein
MKTILDFEASSFSGYPVEVGWCAADLSSGGSALIKRCPDWGERDWSYSAEKLHGITVERLEADGLPADEVVALLNQDIGTGEVISDNPEYEIAWLATLAHGAGIKPTFQFDHRTLEKHLFAAYAKAKASPSWVSPLLLPLTIRQIGLVHHRALDDAILNALKFVMLEVAVAGDRHGEQVAEALRQERIQSAQALLAAHGRRP